MYYLASVVSVKTNRLAVSDEISSFRYRKTQKREKQKRETILTELIPYPEEINLLNLERFKETAFRACCKISKSCRRASTFN